MAERARPRATEASVVRFTMTRGANFWIGVVLLVFSVGLLPGVRPPEDPNHYLRDLAESSLRSEGGGKEPAKVDIDNRYYGFITEERINWLQNIALLIISIVAAVLAMRGKNVGLWAVLALCTGMVLIYVPPMLPDLLAGRFFRTASLVLSTGIRQGFVEGVAIFWHMAVAPFAYMLLAIVTVAALIRASPAKAPA